MLLFSYNMEKVIFLKEDPPVCEDRGFLFVNY
jgi:hypothetical protein